MAVFLVRAGAHGPVQFGSADNVQAEIATWQRGNHATLHLLRTWPGGDAEEKKLRDQFSPYRLDNGWFRLNTAMLSFQMSGSQAAALGVALIKSRRGLASRIAAAIGCSRASVSNWARVPAERVAQIEVVTGIPRHKLRPDLWSAPQSADIDQVA